MKAEPQQAIPDRPRRTRPRNRRALIVAAAAELFARNGYDQTGMSDLAAAVGIGPSALYRHFPGKQQLLAEVVTTGLQPIHRLAGDLDLTERATALSRLAALGLDERHLGVLWQREARHLAPGDGERVRGEIRHVGAQFTERVRAVRPELGHDGAELLAWSLLAVLTSVAFHHVELARPAHDELLAGLLAKVLDTPVPAGYRTPPSPAVPPGLLPASRREALLAQAVRMFAAHGYTEVGIEDIGAAADITGPSVYNHYGSKVELLATAFQRGAAALFTSVAAAYSAATEPAGALTALIRSYVDFGRAHHDLVGLLITEIGHLPAEQQRRGRQDQHDYLGEWVHLLRQVHPDLAPPEARIRVHAAIDVINSAVRIPHLRRNPDLPAALSTLCGGLLGV
ncbi:TetR/AcrR family transcriptional regulator [Amycolatopsis jiangsuensis]|uniref:AcrR family transcriptional regulator n=1 Tax=Amycolatopsis jiangsuensis TaxID=1181879 RepID=A0A840IR86_9PSEU|nr:TetR/AcrR family transcriptional regulator [Amycolatopsis jiangsuensis]MBB4684059.1 AcrR family transcriptional regulator [Amycolatopsis jiangsuensis]